MVCSFSLFSFVFLLLCLFLSMIDKTINNNMSQFSEHIRNLRETLKIRQREVAACLKADTAFVSKLEKGERQARREQVLLLAELFKVDKEELLSLWLAEKVYDLVKDEDVALKSLKTAEKNVKLKNKKTE
jgi:transcriptional regulator with XRE-family HTH domain